MNKQNVVHTVEYHSALKEGNSDKIPQRGWTQGHHAKWNKLVTKKHILGADSLCTKYLE